MYEWQEPIGEVSSVHTLPKHTMKPQHYLTRPAFPYLTNQQVNKQQASIKEGQEYPRTPAL